MPPLYTPGAERSNVSLRSLCVLCAAVCYAVVRGNQEGSSLAENLKKQQTPYLSWLLRLWQEAPGIAPLWRASLESPSSQELQRFASVADLFVAKLQKSQGHKRGQL